MRNAQLGEEKKKDDGEEDGFGVSDFVVLMNEQQITVDDRSLGSRESSET